jgi:hypothetical protein
MTSLVFRSLGNDVIFGTGILSNVPSVLILLTAYISIDLCGGGSRTNAAARGEHAEPFGSSRCGVDDDQGTVKQHWNTNNSPAIAPSHQPIASD